jgi:UDP-N-acetylglucosamine diphosphorylase / glucose-1-phosphate thymidylyltransferase / UDP-N-acetylgalactosamine diphosphorylase / glucosamine-1-phosphate N-acetyltransferase / galactosamine-1-phosphate N-acetyltransferase
MKQAVILAAGEGRRLRPLTVNKPKAMIYIAGKPIIQYVLESLATNGIRDIIMVVGYKREQVFDYVGDGKKFGVDVKYVTQSNQLGTGHALLQAKGATDSEFLVLAGDKLITPDTLTEFVASSPTTILVKREADPSRYGVVTVEMGLVIGMVEKPTAPSSNLINTGIYAFNKDIFQYLESKLDIPDALIEMRQDGIPITAIETEQTWLDVVYPWDILDLNAAILRQIPASHNGTIENGVTLKGQVTIGKGTIIHSNTYISGPVVIGDGCKIGPNTCILPATSIANNVVISPFTEIKNSVIGDDVHIASSSGIEDSVIDKGCVIGGHFCACSEETEVKIDSDNHAIKVGAMLGEGCRIGNGVVAQAGVVVGNYAQIKSFKIISGRLPDKSLVV